MAIDTAEKRRSAAAVSSRGIPGVTPNASKPAAWRQEASWGYSGIAVGAPTETHILCGTLSVVPLLNGTLSLEEC